MSAPILIREVAIQYRGPRRRISEAIRQPAAAARFGRGRTSDSHDLLRSHLYQICGQVDFMSISTFLVKCRSQDPN